MIHSIFIRCYTVFMSKIRTVWTNYDNIFSIKKMWYVINGHIFYRFMYNFSYHQAHHSRTFIVL